MNPNGIPGPENPKSQWLRWDWNYEQNSRVVSHACPNGKPGSGILCQREYWNPETVGINLASSRQPQCIDKRYRTKHIWQDQFCYTSQPATNRTKACAYLSIECCQHSKSTMQLIKCYKYDSLLHHLCETDYASLKRLVERDNVGEHEVCPNLSCQKTCYIVNDDDESPSSPPSTSTTTDNDTKNPSRPTQFALPKVPPEHFLQPASNQKKSKYWRYFWEVNSARCVGADKEFIGKARCKLCIERPHYVSAISGTKSLSFHLENARLLL